MIVELARAIRGYITAKQTPSTITNTRNFKECLKAFLEFENVDILGFDGVVGTMESVEEPSNSLFFYSNNTGDFLYQITSATPRTHKNKLLWDINVIQVEDLSKINNIVGNQSVDWTACIKKQIPERASIFNVVDNKPNFSRIKKYMLPFALQAQSVSSGNNFVSIYTLKLKFMVNPLLSTTLSPNAPDGSYNFLFPLVLDTNGEVCDTILGEITTVLGQVISTYRDNLKSIEVLPFLVNEWNGTKIYNISVNEISNKTINFTSLFEFVTLTSAGIYVKQDLTGNTQKAYSRYRGDGTPFKDLFGRQVGQESLSINIFDKILNIGGGAKGFLRTPMANIPLDFNIQGLEDELYFTLKEDGYIISGAFNVIVPPHYINYYTDSSGSIFYANATTNAFAFRELERDYITQEENAKISNTVSAFSGATSLATGLLTGNFAVAGGGITSLVEGTVGAVGNQKQRENTYNTAKTNLEDKIATDSLLAKYTGKQVLGSVSIGDFFESTKGAYMAFFIETNYFIQLKQDNTSIIITQEDYDFATAEDTSIGDGGEFYDFLDIDIFRTGVAKFGQYGIVFSLRAIDSLGILGNKIKMSNNIYLPIRFN